MPVQCFTTVNVFTTVFLQCEVTQCFNYIRFYSVGSRHSEAIVKILKKKKFQLKNCISSFITQMWTVCLKTTRLPQTYHRLGSMDRINTSSVVN